MVTPSLVRRLVACSLVVWACGVWPQAARAADVPFAFLIKNGYKNLFAGQALRIDQGLLSWYGYGPLHAIVNGQQAAVLGTAFVQAYSRSVPDPSFAAILPLAALVTLDFGSFRAHLTLFDTPTGPRTTVSVLNEYDATDTSVSGAWVLGDGAAVSGGTADDMVIGALVHFSSPNALHNVPVVVPPYFPLVSFANDPTFTRVSGPSNPGPGHVPRLRLRPGAGTAARLQPLRRSRAWPGVLGHAPRDARRRGQLCRDGVQPARVQDHRRDRARSRSRPLYPGRQRSDSVADGRTPQRILDHGAAEPGHAVGAVLRAVTGTAGDDGGSRAKHMPGGLSQPGILQRGRQRRLGDAVACDFPAVDHQHGDVVLVALVVAEVERDVALDHRESRAAQGNVQQIPHVVAEVAAGLRVEKDARRAHRRMVAPRAVAMLTATIATVAALASCRQPAPELAEPFDVVEASIAEMQNAMREGRTTSRAIVTQYLVRIGLYEDRLNGAIAINPEALAQAAALDRERAAGRVRGPLHGIPVALKDNILTNGGMPTSGGMLAFKHYLAPYDATLVTHLRNAGAIIIAKSTMSELAGWFGSEFRPGGYNAAAGQSYNPYDPRANDDGTPVLVTGGSSSGIGVAASLWAANVGTSTGGSIEGPSNATMLVGIRPSTGRISRYGIIPLTPDQDTAGPMTRTVADAAVMLGVMEGGPDVNDPRTSECRPPPASDYTPFLKADALEGARIGIPRAGIYDARTFPGKARPFPGLKPDEAQSMADAIAALKAAGAEIVDPVDLPSLVATTPARILTSHNICELMPDGLAPDDLCSSVLRYGMKRDFNLWLASLGASSPVATLSELRAWNLAHQDHGAIRYGQGRLDAADAVDLERDKARYERNRAEDLELTRAEGLDVALNGHQLDALLFPGSSGANYATKAGYPLVVVPFGTVVNHDDGVKGSQDRTRPFGVSFVGAHCDDPTLVGIAYAFEQATRRRVPPPHTP